jgi:hypothetical protein
MPGGACPACLAYRERGRNRPAFVPAVSAVSPSRAGAGPCMPARRQRILLMQTSERPADAMPPFRARVRSTLLRLRDCPWRLLAVSGGGRRNRHFSGPAAGVAPLPDARRSKPRSDRVAAPRGFA